MRSGLKFHISRHCALRLSERSIMLECVKNVVCYAEQEKRLQSGSNGGVLKMFTKTDAGRKLIVIAEIKNSNCWLTTAYYEF